jgi:acyl-CoA reductase-like NAD-dependent aldehyde dehydrogenase
VDHTNLTLPTELFIDGVFVAGEGEPERVLNPATGALLVEVPEASTEQVHKAVSAAHRGPGRNLRTARKPELRQALCACARR